MVKVTGRSVGAGPSSGSDRGAGSGAKLMGAALVIGVDGDDTRLAMARRMGADVVLDYRAVDVVSEVKRLTGGGADVTIEAGKERTRSFVEERK